LEARPQTFFELVHFAPDIDQGKVSVSGKLNAPAASGAELKLDFKSGGVPAFSQPIPEGATEFKFDVPIHHAHLWSVEEPCLYEVEAVVRSGVADDRGATYFGMRKISVVNMPGLDFPYIALNNKPIHLQITLDQSYHPEGFYTFPSDAFMRDEILRS